MRYILLVLLAFVTTFASAQVQFLGSPTTTVRNRGNFVSDSLFYLPKRTKAPSDTGALRYQISDSALYVWTGSAWRSTGTAGSAITGSGVAGYMPEFTTATNLDTTRLYHSAGRFGIGTTSPSSYFDVIGTKENIAGEQEGIRVIGSIGGRQGISFGYDSTSADQYGMIASHTGSERTTLNYLAEKHKFTFGQVETAALYIDSLGNVGVRNTSPTYILDVSGTMRSTGNTYLGTTSSETYINTTTDAGAFTLQINGGIYTTREGIYLDGFKDWQLETNNGSLLIYNRSTNVRRLVIDSAGTLSVGAIDNDFGASAIFRVNPNINETYIGSLIDYGNYTLQVDGNFYAKGTGTFTKEISAISATVNAGNPSAATIYSGDDGSAIWRAALSLQHNADVTISAGSGIGIVFSPLASTGSIYYGSAGIKAIRPNNTANNQNTDLTFITRAGASNATTDTEKMRITSAGEVLIGTTTDAGAYALQVAGAMYATGNLNFAGGDISISNISNNVLAFGTNNTERMRLKADGEVLIGTTTDAGAYALQVAGSFYNTTNAVFAATSGTVAIGTSLSAYKLDVAASSGNGIRYTATSTSQSVYMGDNSGLPFISTNGPYALTFGINNGEHFRIHNNTNIGIATTSPSYKLDITGTLRSTGNTFLGTSSSEVYVNTTSDAGAYALQVAGAQYVTGSGVFDPTATGSNYLYVGTTSVRSISGLATGAIQAVGNAGNTGGITIAGQLANNSNGDFLQFVKSRGTSNVAVQNGDQLGGIMWSGADGSNYIRAASIMAYVDAAPGTNDMPSRIEFRVTPDGSTVPSYRMALNNAGELIIQENPTDAGNYKLQVDGAIYNTSTITTGAPTGGSIKPWRLGEAATVSPTSPNRTIRVEIDGTVYYIHAKTTND